MTSPELLEIYASCALCGASIPDWALQLFPLRHARVVLTERRELGLRASLVDGCSVCGGEQAEIHVEDRSKGRDDPH